MSYRLLLGNGGERCRNARIVRNERSSHRVMLMKGPSRFQANLSHLPAHRVPWFSAIPHKSTERGGGLATPFRVTISRPVEPAPPWCAYQPGGNGNAILNLHS